MKLINLHVESSLQIVLCNIGVTFFISVCVIVSYLIALLDYQMAVLMQLDTIIDKQNEGLQMLRQLLSVTRGASGKDMLEDMPPKPLSEVHELNALCENLSNEDFKKNGSVLY